MWPYCILDIDIYHKNSEDADPGTLAGQFTTMNAIGVSSKRVTGLKELVRFVFKPSDFEEMGNQYWVFFRMLNPSWETN